MKITKVETIVVNMPMIIEGSVVPRQGGRARTSMDTLLVRVDTDEGVTGWGEGFGHRIFTATRAAIDSFIGPMCVGRDPTAISALVDELQQVLSGLSPLYRRIFEYRLQDRSVEDVAHRAECSERMAHRALAIVRQQLEARLLARAPGQPATVNEPS